MTMVSEPAWRPKMAEKSWPAVVPKAGNDWWSKLPARNKLPRSLTLKTRAEIDDLLTKGSKLPGEYCNLFWQPSETFRYAILTAKRLGTAVERNRAKRIFREAIRLNRSMLAPNIKIGVVPKANCKQLTAAAASTDVRKLFSQI